MTLVIAHCPDVVIAGYAFAHVLAVIENGVLTPIADASEFAPPRGTIYVPPDHIPPGFRFPDIAVWEVVEDFNFKDSGDSGAKYRARRLDSIPTEIVSVDIPSDASDRIRHILCEDGLRAEGNLAGHPVCIEFSDGILAGPIALEASTEPDRALCNPAQLTQPISAWSPSQRPDEITLILKGRHAQVRRRFLARPALPKPDTYLDLAPLEQALRTLIRQVCKDGPGSFILTKNEQAALVARLSAFPLLDQLEARRQRLSLALKTAISAGSDLAEWSALVSEQPSIQAKIEERARSAEDKARHDLHAKTGGLKQEIAALTAQIDALKADIEILHKEKQRVADEVRTTSDGVHDAIVRRATEAAADVESLLSQTLLLRPFLSATAKNEDASIIERRASSDCTALSPLEAAKALGANLRTCGLLPGDADFLARSALAAALAGQFVRFTGSYAELLARTAAKTLCSSLLLEVSISPALLRPSLIRDALSKLAQEEHGGALVILGSNFASFELYGIAIHERVVERSLSIVPQSPGTLLFGTVSDGGASLPLGPADIEVGPVFNTDTLTWITPRAGSAFVCGHPYGGQWRDSEQADNTSRETFAQTLHRWNAPQPALWTRCITNVFPVLQHLFNDNSSMVVAALVYGWLVPLARCVDVDCKEIEELAISMAPDVLESAPALQKLLAWREGAR